MVCTQTNNMFRKNWNYSWCKLCVLRKAVNLLIRPLISHTLECSQSNDIFFSSSLQTLNHQLHKILFWILFTYLMSVPPNMMMKYFFSQGHIFLKVLEYSRRLSLSFPYSSPDLHHLIWVCIIVPHTLKNFRISGSNFLPNVSRAAAESWNNVGSRIIDPNFDGVLVR